VSKHLSAEWQLKEWNLQAEHPWYFSSLTKTVSEQRPVPAAAFVAEAWAAWKDCLSAEWQWAERRSLRPTERWQAAFVLGSDSRSLSRSLPGRCWASRRLYKALAPLWSPLNVFYMLRDSGFGKTRFAEK